MVEQEDKLRIAIINPDKCKPKKCKQECKKTCPVNKTGKSCIEVMPTSTICFISEALCIGCGMCVKRCPFDAIKIINLPKGLSQEVTHRYGANTFKLHRLPMPRPGEVLGLVGTNGIGKSTALKILGAKLQPNLGNFENPPGWKDILRFFRGSELQNYFTKVLENNLKTMIKVQYVDSLSKDPKIGKVIVGKKLQSLDKKGILPEVIEALDLQSVLEREVQHLSGGELQRFVIGITSIQEADVYMFDEPSSYLDVKQRLKAARMIRSLLHPENYVIAVEHDLSILDYLSDFICVLYGQPGAYGVVTMPYSVREGINIFLAGFIPTENMRFRDDELTFKVVENDTEKEKAAQDERHLSKPNMYRYPSMTKTMGPFSLTVNGGQFQQGEIVVMLGQNGTGKTTLIKVLAGQLKPDDDTIEMPKLNISYKPQTIAPKFEGSVKDLLYTKLQNTWESPLFKTEVLIPLDIESLLDNDVQTLSGGELQRVAIVLALAKPCDIYLIDEPSAYLDSEQRVRASKVMKRWIINSKRSAFIVEHDFIMATYLADKVIVFDGIPAQTSWCTSPEGLVSGMNKFLKLMDITFRRDPTNFRPRINKLASQKDQEQKSAGNYFLMEGQMEEEKKEEEAKKGGKAKAAATVGDAAEETAPKPKGGAAATVADHGDGAHKKKQGKGGKKGADHD